MARNFKYWAQKVLPLVYDESLSYYEIICKIIDKINEIEEVWDPEKIEEILDKALDDYLDTLDIYDEIMQNLDLYFADVKDYNADNTGTTDATAAFTAALASGKGVVVVPPGQYIVNNLVVPSNKTIIGYGAELIANDLYGGKPNIIRNDNPQQDNGYNGAKNIRIEGLGLSAPSLEKCTLLAFGHCNNIHIINCHFHHWNGWHGVEFCGVSNGIIENCTFDNYGSTSGVYSECVQLDYAHQESTFPWFGPYNDIDCQNVKILNNTFLGLTTIRDNAVSPYNYLYSAVGSHTPRANFIRNILIDGNYIENFYQGLEFYDLYDSVISNNIIKGCYIGILLTHYIVRCVVCDNQLTGISTAINHPDAWRGIAVYRPNDTRTVRDNDIHDNHIFDYTYGITYQGINSNIHNNYVTRGILAGIMCGIKESSNQYMYNKLSSSEGDSTHKTLTVNITDGDNITAGGLLICNNLADYCYVNAHDANGSRSYIRDNQFNGGFTYGSGGNENIVLFRNLVGGRYNDGARIETSSGSVNIEGSTWIDLTTIQCKRGGVYLITASATTQSTNNTLSVQLTSPNRGHTESTVASTSISAGYTTTATFLLPLMDADANVTAKVWLKNDGNIANWRVQVIDLAVSPYVPA